MFEGNGVDFPDLGSCFVKQDNAKSGPAAARKRPTTEGTSRYSNWCSKRPRFEGNRGWHTNFLSNTDSKASNAVMKQCIDSWLDSMDAPSWDRTMQTSPDEQYTLITIRYNRHSESWQADQRCSADTQCMKVYLIHHDSWITEMRNGVLIAKLSPVACVKLNCETKVAWLAQLADPTASVLSFSSDPPDDALVDDTAVFEQWSVNIWNRTALRPHLQAVLQSVTVLSELVESYLVDLAHTDWRALVPTLPKLPSVPLKPKKKRNQPLTDLYATLGWGEPSESEDSESEQPDSDDEEEEEEAEPDKEADEEEEEREEKNKLRETVT